MKTLYNNKCINCGAPLHYGEEDKICICEYCNSEYHLTDTIDQGKQINEYLVEIKINGKKRKFYISDSKSHKIFGDAYRDFQGHLVTNCLAEKMELTLIER